MPKLHDNFLRWTHHNEPKRIKVAGGRTLCVAATRQTNGRTQYLLAGFGNHCMLNPFTNYMVNA